MLIQIDTLAGLDHREAASDAISHERSDLEGERLVLTVLLGIGCVGGHAGRQGHGECREAPRRSIRGERMPGMECSLGHWNRRAEWPDSAVPARRNGTGNRS